MKKILFTRFFNHLYYQRFFLEYHLSVFDEVHIFCHYNDFNSIKNNITGFKNVVLLPNIDHRHIGNNVEGEICKNIFDYSIRVSREYIVSENVLIYFADDDEFIELDFDKLYDGINGTVFYDWYLSPNMRSMQLTPLNILDAVLENKCKGRIWNLWNIPIFKDNLILLTRENIDVFSTYTTITGFHRLITKLGRELVLSRSSQYLKVHHLKGVIKNEIKQRVQFKLKQIASEDDWDYRNCSKQFNRLYNDDSYKTWYEQLHKPIDIDQQLDIMIEKYQIDNSSEYLFLEYFH